MSQKKEMLYEGKAKQVFATDTFGSITHQRASTDDDSEPQRDSISRLPEVRRRVESY